MGDTQPDVEALTAEVSRLRAFSIRVSPILKAALELRELGRALESLEDQIDAGARPPGVHGATRCAAFWMMTKQAYDTALEQFDHAVKEAALKEFSDVLATDQDREDG